MLAADDLAQTDHEHHDRELEDDQPRQTVAINDPIGQRILLTAAKVQDHPGQHDVQRRDEDEPDVAVGEKNLGGVQAKHARSGSHLRRRIANGITIAQSHAPHAGSGTTTDNREKSKLPCALVVSSPRKTKFGKVYGNPKAL